MMLRDKGMGSLCAEKMSAFPVSHELLSIQIDRTRLLLVYRQQRFYRGSFHISVCVSKTGSLETLIIYSLVVEINEIIIWRPVLLVKLIITYLIRIFTALYETRNVITLII
jgi:hypothetical protein